MWATWLGTEASCVPQPPGAASGVGTRASIASDPKVRWSANTIASSPCSGCWMSSRTRSWRSGAAPGARSSSCPLMPEVGDERLGGGVAGVAWVERNPEELAAAGRALRATAR